MSSKTVTMVALGLASAFAITTAGPSWAAPVLSITAAVKTAASDVPSRVQYYPGSYYGAYSNYGGYSDYCPPAYGTYGYASPAYGYSYYAPRPYYRPYSYWGARPYPYHYGAYRYGTYGW